MPGELPFDDVGTRVFSGARARFFFNGTHDDYHKPSDEVAKIDGEKEARLVKLLFYLGLEVANADARPKWNPDSFAQIVDAELFNTN